jgi:hypothetical protein
LLATLLLQCASMVVTCDGMVVTCDEKTISAYVAPGKNLDAWLTANGIEPNDGISRHLPDVRAGLAIDAIPSDY